MALTKIGAAWKKEGKNGPFLSGEIEHGNEKVSFLIFPSKEKKGEKSPDYVIYTVSDDEQAPAF
jgi:uncharacterized protein (DUF736 family)